MKKKVSLILVYLILLGSLNQNVYAQNAATNSGGQKEQVQQTIITVPLKKKGENYRDKIEHPVEGFQLRSALNAVDNAFKSRGFNTNDFVATLEKIQTMKAFSNGVQEDEQTAIIDASGADIFVTVDSEVKPDGSGANKASLWLVAYDAATGKKLSTSKQGVSPAIHTNQIDKLIVRAVEAIVEDFLNLLQESFTDIVNNGRQIGISFRVNQGSSINFNSEVNSDGDLLSEAISDWLGKNSYKNYTKPAGGGDALNLNYDVKIPLKNQSTGENYRPKEDFGKLIRIFLKKTLKIDCEISSPQLGQLLVKILGPIKN